MVYPEAQNSPKALYTVALSLGPNALEYEFFERYKGLGFRIGFRFSGFNRCTAQSPKGLIDAEASEATTLNPKHYKAGRFRDPISCPSGLKL